jgi:UDP-3-O-[3-hydroxymyristoyl] glucosamine N-acyltransferase
MINEFKSDHFALTSKKIAELAQIPTQSQFLQIQSLNEKMRVLSCAEPELAGENSLVFISKPEHLAFVEKNRPSIIISHIDLKAPPFSWNPSFFRTPSIAASMSILLPFFDRKRMRFPGGIHVTASISPSAVIGQNVRIGAYSVIGENVVIEDNVTIGPHCNLEMASHVGQNSLLHSHVFLGASCVLGERCEIHPFTCIGSDGFGYVQDAHKKRHKIPQIGRVRIGNDVEIGSSCTIDRATLSETVIGDGTKIDNLCHFAHNVKIGRNGAITAGFNVAGSSEIGDNFMSGGQAGVSDHMKVVDNVTVGARAGIVKDVTEPGMYSGFPLEPMRSAMKTLASLPHLSELRKTVAKIQKKLNIE